MFCRSHFIHLQMIIDFYLFMAFLKDFDEIVFLFSSFWVVCADMAAQYSVPDPGTPGKMFMNYQGLASYLSSGGWLFPRQTHLYFSTLFLSTHVCFLTRWQLLGDWHRLWQLCHHLRLPHPKGGWQLWGRLCPRLLQEPPRPPSRHPARGPSEAGWHLHGRAVPACAAVWSLLTRKRRGNQKVEVCAWKLQHGWLCNVKERVNVKVTENKLGVEMVQTQDGN